MRAFRSQTCVKVILNKRENAFSELEVTTPLLLKLIPAAVHLGVLLRSSLDLTHQNESARAVDTVPLRASTQVEVRRLLPSFDNNIAVTR
ncbi:UNVERIFIED_CONTAM: hypothetical protein Sangu_2463900 [Sesamum angustifolium]|uniref:Uncharacterized protein n=1 Tax=Sesamum angustifolium TaxID=2727405 RepID=A0AAW2J7C3_9LAMI